MRCYDIVANYDNFVNCVLNFIQEALVSSIFMNLHIHN